MTFPTLGAGCSGSAFPGKCFGYRGVVCTCSAPDNDGVNQPMIDWCNNFDLTTVPWGILRSFIFDDVTAAAPDTQYTVDANNPGPDAISQCFLVQGDGTPFPNATVQRCQVWWPGQSQFGALAIDSWNALQTAYQACTGVTGACGSIYELPIPRDVQGAPLSNRIHYVAHLGLTAANITAYYESILAFGVAANYGPNWDVTPICHPTGEDPFTGDSDP